MSGANQIQSRGFNLQNILQMPMLRGIAQNMPNSILRFNGGINPNCGNQNYTSQYGFTNNIDFNFADYMNNSPSYMRNEMGAGGNCYNYGEMPQYGGYGMQEQRGGFIQKVLNLLPVVIPAIVVLKELFGNKNQEATQGEKPVVEAPKKFNEWSNLLVKSITGQDEETGEIIYDKEVKDFAMLDEKGLASIKKLNDLLSSGSEDKAAISSAEKEVEPLYSSALKAMAKEELSRYANKDNNASTVNLDEYTEADIEEFKKEFPNEKITAEKLEEMKAVVANGFTHMDVNNDNIISEDEFAADFAVMDGMTDLDGVITKKELEERSLIPSSDEKTQTDFFTKKMTFIETILNPKKAE